MRSVNIHGSDRMITEDVPEARGAPGRPLRATSGRPRVGPPGYFGSCATQYFAGSDPAVPKRAFTA